MNRTILVAATLDDAGHDALMLGIELARPLGANIVLSGVAPEPRTPWQREDNDLDMMRQKLNELRDSAPTDVPVSVVAISADSVLGGLHNLAESLDAQLLVLGPSHRGRLERALRGDLTADAVFTAPCGVAVAAAEQAEPSAQRIGVAWNATPEADEALEWAVQLAGRTGGIVHIVHVLEDIRLEVGSPDPQAETRLEAVCWAAQQRASADTELAWGDPGPVLAGISRDLDLLVIGSRGRGPVLRTLLGSVSTRVLHDAHCPVVVLPRGVHAPSDTAVV